MDTLRRNVEQWENQRNATGTKVGRQFTTVQARAKLRSLYPSDYAWQCTSQEFQLSRTVILASRP